MEPFKNVFSQELVGQISGHLGKHIADFNERRFQSPILAALEDLELKERAQIIADHVHLALPADHGSRAEILLAILHPDDGELSARDNKNGLSGWGVHPLTMVVGQHGLDDFDRSLTVLREMTKRFTSEFGVRYFLLSDQDRALAIMRGWIKDENVHVRRLISEGTRPRLPWAMQLPALIADPSPMLPILEALRDDEEEYVRRSVANHLNDIAKDHPDLVAEIAKDWMQDADKNRHKLIRHACRTLIKAGHKGTLEAFGLAAPQIEIPVLTIKTPQVVYGEALEFQVELRSLSRKPQTLLIDYLVHFRKANGQLVGKVFKWTKVELQPGEVRQFNRKHAIRPITTRKYYAGQQGVSVRINGEDFGDGVFDLIMPDVVG
jgi:3-methyladenine DNA glycosylase AlkC